MNNSDDRKKATELALGRLFGVMSRPHQEGDLQEYEKCRALIMSLHDVQEPDYEPNWAADRLKGAAGD